MKQDAPCHNCKHTSVTKKMINGKFPIAGFYGCPHDCSHPNNKGLTTKNQPKKRWYGFIDAGRIV